MYYEINIAKQNKTIGANGRYEHYFATADRSITDRIRMEKVYADIKKAFPEPDFKISVVRWELVGETINMSLPVKEQKTETKQITTDYCPRTGLLIVTQHEPDNERSVFLTKEDITDIMSEALKHRIADQADFN
jgi:hypothetical protein